MPKRPICQTSLCCRHLMSIKRCMRNAHAGFMSNQLMLETSDVGKTPIMAKNRHKCMVKAQSGKSRYIIMPMQATYRSSKCCWHTTLEKPMKAENRDMTVPVQAICQTCQYRQGHQCMTNAHAGYMSDVLVWARGKIVLPVQASCYLYGDFDIVICFCKTVRDSVSPPQGSSENRVRPLWHLE